MGGRPVVLAVDDDAIARAFILQTLSTLDADVHVASSRREFQRMIGKACADLYLLDVDLPDGDGFSLIKELRAESLSPVIFLSVHTGYEYRLRGLELGSIEYLEKPIGPREFTLRIQNILVSLGHRRGRDAPSPADEPAPAGPIRRFGGFTFDVPRRRLVDGDGSRIPLTASEFEVLSVLTARPQRVMNREEIARHLGPRSAARYNARIVDVLIWRLRRKLGGKSARSRFIATAPSQGYMFIESVSPA